MAKLSNTLQLIVLNGWNKLKVMEFLEYVYTHLEKINTPALYGVCSSTDLHEAFPLCTYFADTQLSN